MFLHIGFWFDCFHTCPLTLVAVNDSKMRVSGISQGNPTDFLRKRFIHSRESVTLAPLNSFLPVAFLSVRPWSPLRRKMNATTLPRFLIGQAYGFRASREGATIPPIRALAFFQEQPPTGPSPAPTPLPCDGFPARVSLLTGRSCRSIGARRLISVLHFAPFVLLQNHIRRTSLPAHPNIALDFMSSIY